MAKKQKAIKSIFPAPVVVMTSAVDRVSVEILHHHVLLVVIFRRVQLVVDIYLAYAEEV